MSHSVHPGAEQDIADALDFYNEHAGPLVATRFLDEFERVVSTTTFLDGLSVIFGQLQ